MKTKKDNREKTQNFLLTFFDSGEKYQEREINGYFLVKYHSGSSGKWGVMIYTRDSFRKYKEFNESKKSNKLWF